jgi:hypothetical protein
MAETSGREEAMRTIEDAATVPLPRRPERSEFVSEDEFVDAWSSWQAEALERALSALETVRRLAGTDPAAPVAAWGPGELLSVSMLRSALMQAERNTTGAWPYSEGELARVRGLLERTNPEVSVAVFDGNGEARQWTGWAWEATHWLAPGVYDAAGVQDGQRYRLLVGPVADQVAGEASAAFRVGDADRAVVDRIAATLEGFSPAHAARAVDQIATVVEGSGRDLGDSRSAITRLAVAERARQPSPQEQVHTGAARTAWAERARQINAAPTRDEMRPGRGDVVQR